MRDEVDVRTLDDQRGCRWGRHIAWTAAGIAALATGWSTHAAYRRDIRAARVRVGSGVVAQTLSGPIEYASLGSGPPVLVVHGAGGGFDQGLDLGAPLARHGFRVIAMSRFGYLRTPLPRDASAIAQADAHAALLDQLGVAEAVILGASAGAPSAMQFALRHAKRCRAMVLVVPAAYVPRAGGGPSITTPSHTPLLFDTALRSDFLFWAASRLCRDMFISSILGTPPDVVHHASTAEQARVVSVLEHLLPVSARRLGLLNEAAVVSGLGRYDLESIHVPTLTLSTADDRYGTYDAARYTAEHVRGARFVGYATGGHLLVGHGDDVFAEIVAFLNQ